MCGIVGYVGRQAGRAHPGGGPARLEYRGYDSAGVAVLGEGGCKVRQEPGRVRELEAALPKRFAGKLGIGHTRWATHGGPSDVNAHPHLRRRRADRRRPQRHHRQRRRRCATSSRPTASSFVSETDTEVLAHLIAASEADTLEEKVMAALRRIEGTYGIAVIDVDFPDRIVVARNGSPLILGIGDSEMHVASDVAALVRYTRQVVYLDDGELATVTRRRLPHLHPGRARPPPRAARPSTWEAEDYDGRPRALHAQGDPRAARRGRPGHARPPRRALPHRPPGRPEHGRRARPRSIRRVKILGCGSAYYAARSAPSSSRSWPGSPPTPSRPRSSATATRSSSPTRSTSRSASPARPRTPSPRCRSSSARAAA